MRSLRSFLRCHPALVALALAVMLAARLLIPSGYMIAGDSKLLTVVICSGVVGDHPIAQLAIPAEGKNFERGDSHGGAKADPCPYSSLSMAATAGADAPLLAAALAFTLALGFAPVAQIARQKPSYLRPPLRAPPVIA